MSVCVVSSSSCDRSGTGRLEYRGVVALAVSRALTLQLRKEVLSLVPLEKGVQLFALLLAWQVNLDVSRGQVDGPVLCVVESGAVLAGVVKRLVLRTLIA